MINQHEIKRPVTVCDCGSHAFVNLTRGYVALISPQDADLVGRWSWSALVLPDGKKRAVRRENKSSRFFYMHKQIIQPADGQVVDHINADGIDNRRENLRACVQGENVRNQRPQRRKKSSRFKGVSYDKSRGKWQAYVNVNGKRKSIGRFDTETEAALEYDAAATIAHGAFALTNRSLGLYETTSPRK